MSAFRIIALSFITVLGWGSSPAFAQPLICYFGDSITEGWIEAELHPRQAYPALTDSILRSRGVVFTSILRGAGGQTTDDALWRLERDVLVQHPYIVTVSFGSNDRYIWGSDPAPRVAPDRFATNLRLLVTKLRGVGIRVVLLGLPPLDERRFYHYADSSLYVPYGGAERMQSTYDSVIATVADNMGCRFVSLKSAFTHPATQLGFDGVHPTPDGHRVIATVLSDAITAAFSDSKPSISELPSSVYPNPFSTSKHSWCIVRFHLEGSRRVTVRIVGSNGRVLRKIVYWSYTTGNHHVAWDGLTDTGTQAASGSYMVYITAFNMTAQHRLLLM